MARDSQFGATPQIAAHKTREVAPIDLMRPGNGTPWEDRGTIGPIPAYFKTVLKSITSPGLLLDHLRRPETTADAVSFAMTSGAMWIVGVIAWRIWKYRQYTSMGWDVAIANYLLTVLGQCALVGAGIWLFVKLGSNLYVKLSAAELRNTTPNLILNLFCYCMGPSLLAVVPVFGQGLALLLIFIDLIVAGKKRLYLKGASAVVNALIIFICAALIGVVAYFVLGYLWGSYFEMSGVTPPAPPPAIRPRSS